MSFELKGQCCSSVTASRMEYLNEYKINYVRLLQRKIRAD